MEEGQKTDLGMYLHANKEVSGEYSVLLAENSADVRNSALRGEVLVYEIELALTVVAQKNSSLLIRAVRVSQMSRKYASRMGLEASEYSGCLTTVERLQRWRRILEAVSTKSHHCSRRLDIGFLRTGSRRYTHTANSRVSTHCKTQFINNLRKVRTPHGVSLPLKCLNNSSHMSL